MDNVLAKGFEYMERVYTARLWLVFVIAPLYYALVLAIAYVGDMSHGALGVMAQVVALSMFFLGAVVVLVPARVAMVNR